MVIDYAKPARMDDLLDIRTWTATMKGASMHLAQEVRRGDELLVKAEVVVACVRDGRAIRLPDSLRMALGRPALRVMSTDP